jgi:hypothetical protein
MYRGADDAALIAISRRLILLVERKITPMGLGGERTQTLYSATSIANAPHLLGAHPHYFSVVAHHLWHQPG